VQRNETVCCENDTKRSLPCAPRLDGGAKVSVYGRLTPAVPRLANRDEARQARGGLPTCRVGDQVPTRSASPLRDNGLRELLDPPLALAHELLRFRLLGHRHILVDEPASRRNRRGRLFEGSRPAPAAYHLLLRLLDLCLRFLKQLVATAARRADLLELGPCLRLMRRLAGCSGLRCPCRGEGLRQNKRPCPRTAQPPCGRGPRP